MTASMVSRCIAVGSAASCSGRDASATGFATGAPAVGDVEENDVAERTSGHRRRAARFDEVYAHLSRLALELDETIDGLEDKWLSDGEAAILALPIAHLQLGLRRLDQVVHEAEQLDQRPRIARLRAESSSLPADETRLAA